VENRHVDAQGKASPHQFKRAYSYSDDEDDCLHCPVQDSNSIYATFPALAGKKAKKARHQTA
jgi:hypothetical protein